MSAITPLTSEESTSATEPCCEKCQVPQKKGTVTVCPRCGWYPSLGIFVEIAHEWEVAFDTDRPMEDRPPAPSHFQVWARLIPGWVWALFGTAAGIALVSFGVRLGAPTEGFRTAWSIGQLLGGVVLGVACHAIAFVMAAADDNEIGVLDAVVKPLRAWLRLAADLPERFWLAEAGTVGFTSALCAMLIIGGIPYSSLLDWKIKAPPKQSLMGAVLSQAQKVEGEKKELSDAVSDFAGQAGDGVLDGNPAKKKPAPRQDSDCLVIGYLLNPQGKIHQFLLAVDLRGRLVYAGKATAEIPVEEEPALLERLQASKTGKPFVNAPDGALWLLPKFTCRVSFAKQKSDGQLTELKFEEMRSEIKLPW